jgi:hypothetical protein
MELSTNMFWWDAEAREFRQEISSLDLKPNATFQKGITLRNPTTCGRQHFMYEKTHYDDKENEVTHWSFRNYDLCISILIWND